ncbi:MAG: hypothetical protein Q9197_006003 [Variospora fuerteventurae]
MRRQTFITKHKLAPRPLPSPLVEEDIAASFRAVAEGDGFAKGRVLGQPHHEVLVVAPVAPRELGRGQLLHQVARLRVEDPEEGFVAERGDLVAQAVHVVDGVAFGELEVGLQGAGGRFGEGSRPGGPEGSRVGWLQMSWLAVDVLLGIQVKAKLGEVLANGEASNVWIVTPLKDWLLA